MATDSVLLLDEDPVFLKILTCVLDTAGYDVTTTQSENEALARVREQTFAVAVIPLELREGTCEDLVRALYSLAPDTECIVLAPESRLIELLALYEIGNIFNHRWKPLDDIGDLARDLARAIERRALRHQNAYLLTELRNTRDELRNQAEFRIQVEKLAALGQITGGVSQALDAPLQDATRRLSTLSSATLSERQEADVRTAQQSLAVARSLVCRLRSFSEQSPTAREATDLNILIEETLSLLRPSLLQWNIRLKVELAPDLPTFQADFPRLQQALLHLLLNALFAMPEGGVLRLRTEALSGKRGGVRLQIHDTGKGIAQEELPHVFKPFSNTWSFGRETGSGLAVTRSIVEDHAGEITIDSAQEAGTTVILTFPARTVPVKRESLRTRAA